MTEKKQTEKAEEVKLFNPNDGLFKRDGGPYLDEVQARQAEEIRAYREGREPDYDNLQPHPGVPLVSEEQLIRNAIGRANGGDVTLTNIKDQDLHVYATVPREVLEATEPVDEAKKNDPALADPDTGNVGGGVDFSNAPFSTDNGKVEAKDEGKVAGADAHSASAPNATKNEAAKK